MQSSAVRAAGEQQHESIWDITGSMLDFLHSILVHFFNCPSMERGGYPEKNTQQASSLRFPIQLEVKTKEFVREMEFSPLNFCAAQNIGNLGESNKATTHGENIFMPPTAFKC